MPPFTWNKVPHFDVQRRGFCRNETAPNVASQHSSGDVIDAFAFNELVYPHFGVQFIYTGIVYKQTILNECTHYIHNAVVILFSTICASILGRCYPSVELSCCQY